jgi:hypothetical protein
MSLSRALVSLTLSVLLVGTAHAQQSAQQATSQQPLQQAMSPEDFQAAGLQKLTPQELKRLNEWLDRRIDVESRRAAELAQDRLKSETRGFLNFGSSEPIVSTLVGEFRGFQRGRNYGLANGQQWEQIDDASLVGVRKTDPAVKITPSLVGNAWYLAIDGYNTRAKVRRVK